MGTVKSTQRERFEKAAFPHVEALRRTALWLTMHRSSAEDLLLNTMEQAYCSWWGSVDTVGSKAALFRILVRGSVDVGNRRHHRRGFLPENGETVVHSDNGSRPHRVASIDRRELSLLTGIPDMSVKAAVARLRPQSRLIMILLIRERFSHADIAYITDLEKDSVKSILVRLRRLIPRYLVQHEDSTVTTSPSRSVDQVQMPSFDESQYPCSLPAGALLSSENRGDQIGDCQTQNTLEVETSLESLRPCDAQRQLMITGRVRSRRMR